MKYSEFKAKVEALGYLVAFESYGVTKVMNKSGDWLASDFGITPYNFMINLYYDNMDLWGSEAKRCFLSALVIQLTSTEIKNRGKLPIEAVA